MGAFDIILLIILSWFVFYGLFYGLIRSIGSIAGLLLGFWAASTFYLNIYELFKAFFFGYDKVGHVLMFLLTFSIVNRLVCFGFALLDKAFDIISIIPFLNVINRLAGAIFGLVLGGLTIGFAIYAIRYYPWLGDHFNKYLDNSKVVPYLEDYTSQAILFLPGIFSGIKNWLNGLNLAEKFNSIDSLKKLLDFALFWKGNN